MLFASARQVRGAAGQSLASPVSAEDDAETIGKY